MLKVRLVSAVVAAVLCGCGTQVGSAAMEQRSGFSGSRVVTISGHGNACKSMTCTGLGAQWDSSLPEAAILEVYVFNEFKGITGASLAIDGVVTPLNPMPGLTRFSPPGSMLKTSQHGFTVPLATIRKVVAAKKVWLRVSTTAGYVEDAVLDAGEDSKAFHAMKRFLAQIDGQSAS